MSNCDASSLQKLFFSWHAVTTAGLVCHTYCNTILIKYPIFQVYIFQKYIYIFLYFLSIILCLVSKSLSVD